MDEMEGREKKEGRKISEKKRSTLENENHYGIHPTLSGQNIRNICAFHDID